MEKSLLSHPEKKNKKIYAASQKSNLPTHNPTDQQELTKKGKPLTGIGLLRADKELLLIIMAKKKGIGGELKLRSFDWKPPNQYFDTEKRNVITFGLAKD